MQPFMLQEAQLLQKGCATHYAKLQSHSTSSKEKFFLWIKSRNDGTQNSSTLITIFSS